MASLFAWICLLIGLFGTAGSAYFFDLASKEEAAKSFAAASVANERAAKLEAASEQLRKETAEANERTASAELRLKQLEPRKLDVAKFADLLKDSATSETEIVFVADDFDCVMLAQSISQGLRLAGWPSVTPSPIVKSLDWDRSAPEFVGGQPTGVTLVRRSYRGETTMEQISMPDSPVTAFDVLSRALLLTVGKSASHVNGPVVPRENLIRIVVAPKA